MPSDRERPVMPSERLTRRRLLGACGGTLAGLAGCLSTDAGTMPSTPTPVSSEPREQTAPGSTAPGPAETSTTTGESGSPPDDGSPLTTTGSGAGPTVASLAVRDFFQYALSGTHPHVHRSADTQYVFVRVETDADPDAVRRRLTLSLDGSEVPTAARRPVAWEHETVDVAFAVSKQETVERGTLTYGDHTLRSLADETVERLNNPPVFEVSGPSVSPTSLREGAERDATVRFTLNNDGDGRGTFGASLKGNYVSGSALVTATLDPGESREVATETTVVGRESGATVILDWGADTWSTTIPVADGGTATTSSGED